MSEKQYRDKITQVVKQQADAERDLGKARQAATKHRTEAARQRARITPRTSAAMARSYESAAQRTEANAVSEDRKVANLTAKLAGLAKDRANAQTNLERESRLAQQRSERDVRQRRDTEIRHARELARIAQPTTRYIRDVRPVPVPRAENLRILYLTASPEPGNPLRVDVEVRDVKEAVRRATHRDRVEINLLTAATPEDLLQGLNDFRPHVVHFSGHAGAAEILLDNVSMTSPEGRSLPYPLLARVLSATDTPPRVLVLNGCDTLDGAEDLLAATPVVVAMAASVSDQAAGVFASRFYAAIASAQPLSAALEQAALAVEFLGGDEGWKPASVSREGVDLGTLVLVQTDQHEALHP